MSSRLALSLAVLVFLVTLLARLPARTIAPLLPSPLVCDQAQGTVWHGSCARLSSGMFTLSDLGWTLHPAGLLRLNLSAEVTSADPRLTGRAHVQLERGGNLEVRDLSAQLPLQQGLSIFPSGFAGTIDVEVTTLRLENGALADLVGAVRALTLRSDGLGELGSFELLFPAGADLRGELRDLSGPLAVQGEVRLTRPLGYEVSGSVITRPSASPELSQSLQLLGPPDSEGRRSFSLAGTL